MHKIPSLVKKASAQVAINLSQENGFKDVVLQLEKPTYGMILNTSPPFLVSDPEKLSTWNRVKEDDRLVGVLMNSWRLTETERLQRWDTAVGEQCQRLTGGIPRFLRPEIQAWMRHSALEYLCYSKKQEMLFGVSRYLLVNILTREDWKEDGRLDEEKITQRLVEDERFTVLQRYRMACVYCMYAYISELWKRLTQEEKNCCLSKELSYRLVVFWSRHIRRGRQKSPPWYSAVREARWSGNQSAVRICWRELQEDARQKIIIREALKSIQGFESDDDEFCKANIFDYPGWQAVNRRNSCILVSHYTDGMLFFLSQMDEEQQLSFFNKAFQSNDQSGIIALLCLLDWPHQDKFFPTINRLWGILPYHIYGHTLITLAHKISDERKNRDCDYRGMVETLWENTPEEYKHYVFWMSVDTVTEGHELLHHLLKSSTFREKDEALFKRVFRDLTQEERKVMQLSEVGKDMCSLLTRKEKWHFLNWLLEECLPKEEIPDFKKQFIQSDCGVKLCLQLLEENRERLVECALDWWLESDADRKQSKEVMISSIDSLDACGYLLREGKFAVVERIINFFLFSDECKERFRVRFAQGACRALYRTEDFLLDDCVWKQMDTIVAWSVDTEEKIRDFKIDLFSQKGVDIHFRLVFRGRWWRKVEGFYQWFELTAEEIKKLKKDTLFTHKAIEDLEQSFWYWADDLSDIADEAEPFLWCLTDEQMLIDFKNEFVKRCITGYSDEKEAREALDRVMRELLMLLERKKLERNA